MRLHDGRNARAKGHGSFNAARAHDSGTEELQLLSCYNSSATPLLTLASHCRCSYAASHLDRMAITSSSAAHGDLLLINSRLSLAGLEMVGPAKMNSDTSCAIFEE